MPKLPERNRSVFEFLLVLRSAPGGSVHPDSGWPQAFDALVHRIKNRGCMRRAGGIFRSRSRNYADRHDLDYHRQRIRARDSILYSGVGNPASGSGAVLSNGKSRRSRCGATIASSLERMTQPAQSFALDFLDDFRGDSNVKASSEIAPAPVVINAKAAAHKTN